MRGKPGTKTPYISQSKLASLEEKGLKLTESTRFSGVNYKPDRDGINIYAGACGNLQVDWDRLEELIDELYEFKEVYDDKQQTKRQARGA